MEDSVEGCESGCGDDCNEKGPELNSLPLCKCIRLAEHDSRFVLRLLEALRVLRHEGKLVASSRIEEIVEFFRQNYRDAGDLESQVRTGLRQICSQGLAMELFEHEYYFVGPWARSMNRNASQNPKCLACSSSKSVQDCTPINCQKEDSTSTDGSRENVRKLRNCRRNERKNKSASNSTSDCSDCDAIARCRNANRSTREYKEFEKSFNLMAPNEYRNDNKSSSSIKRKRNSCRGRRKNNPKNQNSTALDSQTTDFKNSARKDEALSEDTDDIYQQTRNHDSSQESKTREGELKSWIKRCRKECRNQKKH